MRIVAKYTSYSIPNVCKKDKIVQKKKPLNVLRTNEKLYILSEMYYFVLIIKFCCF